jgi:hypothetical protein
MGGENPPRIDAGRGGMPRRLRQQGQRRRRNGERNEPASRHITGESVDQPISHQPGEKAEHQRRLERFGLRA